MRYITLLLLMICHQSFADTMNHFTSISSNISKMEMKADPQAQAWARSARNVLIITAESIAETLMQANEHAKAQKAPLFCLPAGQELTAKVLISLIEETYQNLPSQQSDKDRMTVSQVAWIGVRNAFPCGAKTARTQQMQHVSSILGR